MTVKRLIEFSPHTWQFIVDTARRQCRDPRQQVEFLIRELAETCQPEYQRGNGHRPDDGVPITP